MPLYTTVIDDILVVRCIPNPHPRTYHSGSAIVFVLIDAFALQLLANRQPLMISVLIQCCICSGGAIITVVICITYVILVSGHPILIHIELHGNLS